MRTIATFLLIAFLQCCFGQTDTKVIAVGDWSKIVRDDERGTKQALRGRLLIYDDQGQSALNHARVYLEWQNVFEGAWPFPAEVYISMGSFMGGGSCDLFFEMRDALGRPIPPELVPRSGTGPYPYHVMLPCDSTIRLRVDDYVRGSPSEPDGLVISVCGGRWVVRPNATNDFFLSATLTAPKVQPTPFKYHVWQWTLNLPKVRIPVKKQ
jgi:hypothetical protein